MCSFRESYFLFGLNIGCIVLIAICPCEAVAAGWKERLLSEAPPKWTALEQYYSKMEVSSRMTYPTRPSVSAQFPDIVYVDIRKNGEWMVSTMRRVGKGIDGKRMDTLNVYGVNSHYAFELGKTSPDADTFVLANFQSASDEMRRKVHAHGEHNFSSAFEVQAVPLSEFIKDPLVAITDVRSVRRGEREMAQLDYARQLVMHDRNDSSKAKASGTEHGTVVLDPEHYWCVRECHFDRSDCKSDMFLEYGDDVDGFPILRRYQDTTTYKDGTGSMVINYEFDKLVHRDIPESEFTLSAFGLPEMQLPSEQKPRTLWRWLTGIGIVLGTLAILLRVYLKKKRQAQQGV